MSRYALRQAGEVQVRRAVTERAALRRKYEQRLARALCAYSTAMTWCTCQQRPQPLRHLGLLLGRAVVQPIEEAELALLAE